MNSFIELWSASIRTKLINFSCMETYNTWFCLNVSPSCSSHGNENTAKIQTKTRDAHMLGLEQQGRFCFQIEKLLPCQTKKQNSFSPFDLVLFSLGNSRGREESKYKNSMNGHCGIQNFQLNMFQLSKTMVVYHLRV